MSTSGGLFSLFLIISALLNLGATHPDPVFRNEPDKLSPVERIVISGASGLVGSALVPSLESQGHEITRLVRRPARDSHEIHWDPMQQIPSNLVSGFDAVIHLSGESVRGRWTSSKTRRIRQSRVISTRNLSQALASTEKKPAVFLCASAIGYYGNRGDEILTEGSPAGTGFLAEVSREWENATKPAFEAGIRTVNIRIGIVLSRQGGALKAMLLPFRLGLGGRIGNGRQWWSWIHIADLVAAVEHILSAPEGAASSPVALTGPVNLVSASPTTNLAFTRTLADALHRPALLPIPAAAAKLAFGQFAVEGLLASAKVEPNKLLASNFAFRFPDLASAFDNLLC